MLIRAYSDLHLETNNFVVPPLDTDGASTLILAGDLDTGIGIFKNKWPKSKGVQKSPWIVPHARRFRHVLVVFGNHDYWSESIGHAEDKARRLLAMLDLPNVHILSANAVVLDGVKFIGATLWTDYAQGDADCMWDAQQTMNDFLRIRQEEHKRIKHARYFLHQHQAQRNFIENALAEPFDGPKVVLTHHAPSLRSFPDSRPLSERGQYASDLEYLMHGPHAPAFWFHGHIHRCQDYQVGQTRVIANALGYRTEALPSPVYRLDSATGES